MNIEFYLAYPPSVNNYYVKTKRGVFISAKGRKYRADVIADIAEQIPALRMDEDHRILMEVVLFPPDKRKRDLDNTGKSLLDALVNAKLLIDDSQIDQLHFYRGAPVPNGRVFIRISDAGPVIPVGMKP